MLSKKEKIVMQYIYSHCQKKGSCLLSSSDISSAVAETIDLSLYEVDEIISNLVLENYITAVNSDKNGRPVYCISLNSKGASFERDRKNQKKAVIKIVIRTILVACLSFAVTCILKAIFS